MIAGARFMPRVLSTASAAVFVGGIVALFTVQPGVGTTPSGSPIVQGAARGDGERPGGGLVPTTGSQDSGGASPAQPLSSSLTPETPVRVVNGWDFPATLSPTCAMVGSELTLTMNVGPRGSGVLQVVYGNDAQGPHAFVEPGADGLYVFTWRATGAPGYGLVLVVGSDESRARSGTKSIPFRLVGAKERC